MSELDPVPWEEIEAATGPPTATEVESYIEDLRDEITEESAFEAVKAVYDEWKTDLGDDRTLSDQGAAFVITYLLERERIIDLRGLGQGSLVKRHPGADELRERFWEQEQTLWWLAVELGVHHSLVTFWLWEADIPLAERNLGPETMEKVEAHRRREEDSE
ncbi:hypothetical protein [Halorussus ruber]|uniref:hypothetical protein n=1 Tax=Halorussus ruber TaxID=1126238 RepID=UPI0010920E7B|nr:hypothetical protein [Halorussus ruber]